ncbi:X-ray radiation resistance-associated protein 1-like [Haliotis rufescens]|uniref:X-ray radiation resistance-associated protein 1-like n=1 Tax=Haliotis rufescens TaxID=6454 RepID=UPI00201F32CB|nr:X-ray radiation resistance-associated protein 1-like [Haliotis rufescens]
MATEGLRFDDGSGVFASNCFPVRSIFGHGYDGGGAWLIAHRAEQRRRFKAVLCTKPRTYSRIREERKKTERLGTTLDGQKFDEDEEEEEEEAPTLDGFFLMKQCCVEDPSDLCSINIAGKELSEVKEDDFSLFDNVAYVNAGENYLPFEAFRGFPIIRELEMPLNGLRSLKIDVTDYPFLELLDLSYNNLSSEDVLALGLLQNLKVLHLTGNNFKTLPADMSLPYIPDPKQKTRYQRFTKLEVLMLDDNKLGDVSVFAALAGLQKLHHLNMEKNQIAYVPQLKSVEGKVVTQEITIPEKKSKSSAKGGRSSRRSKSRASNSAHSGNADVQRAASPEVKVQIEVKAEALKEVSHLTKVEEEEEAVNVEDTEKPKMEANPVQDNTTTEEKELLNDDLSLNVGDLTARMNELNDDAGETTHQAEDQQAQCPFPELRYLSLAHNQISDEDALLAVAAWPMLVELVIHSNPLTTNHSGNPPLLKRFLQDRLGIKLVRKEQPSIVKPHLEVHTRKHRTVSGTVPKVPKPSIEDRLMLEAPPQQAPQHPGQGERTLSGLDLQKPLPPISPRVSKECPQPSPRVDAWTEDKMATTSSEDAFFMTQVDDQEEEKNAASEEKTEKRERRKSGKISDRYCGYEELLDVDSDEEDGEIPKDIQGNVRALKYALTHQLVYRDPSVHLDKVTRPVPEYRRVPVPPPKPKTQAEKVDEVLENLRTRSTVDEASLVDVLSHKKQYKKQFPEAQSLLQQIQRRYNVVRVSSMKEAREARKHMQGAADEVGKANKHITSLKKKGVKVCE